MYVWQWAFDEDTCMIGRTWDEFLAVCEELSTYLKKRNCKIVSYVHNLAYEFQYIQGVYKFNPSDVFAVKSRRVLKATMMDAIEFRCSYLHSNMSLGKFLEKMDVPVQKKTLDYSKTRYPWTWLTPEEMDYNISDVVGLVQAIKKEMENDSDNLISIPLTSTGYVRREVKKSMQRFPHQKLQELLPPYEVFQLLEEEFRGGDTHANRRFAGKIIKNAESHDRSSSYPAVQCNEKFPMGKWARAKKDDEKTLRNAMKDYPCIFRIAFTNLRMRDDTFPDPVLSKSKARNCRNVAEDNGRILSADYCETTLCDVDFKCYEIAYKWDGIKITDLWISHYDYLPKEFTSVTKEYYKRKTELKGIPDQEYFYFKSKNKINGIYGMTAQNPVRNEVAYAPEEMTFSELSADTEENYNRKMKKAWMSYAWACWTTALARYHLFMGIVIAWKNGYAYYWDTDSVKHSPGISYEKYNIERVAECKKTGAYAIDSKGNAHYMGVYESEGTYDEFKTLGAKKYAYMQDGDLHITIAGVNKKKGAEELKRAGGLSAFQEGFIFIDGGGTESVYNNDTFTYDVPDGSGRTLKITPNVAIVDSTYKLGITGEYERLLAGYRDIL